MCPGAASARWGPWGPTALIPTTGTTWLGTQARVRGADSSKQGTCPTPQSRGEHPGAAGRPRAGTALALHFVPLARL